MLPAPLSYTVIVTGSQSAYRVVSPVGVKLVTAEEPSWDQPLKW